jgi:hypothetical protein
LRVAPVRRRFAASLIDALVGIVALVLLVGTGVGIFRVARARPVNFKFLGGLVSGLPNASIRLQSRPVKLIVHIAMFAVSVRTRERRSPGSRILGLRRVDARTGRDVSRTQEVIRSGARQGWRFLCRQLIRTPKARASPEWEKLKSDLEAARHRHADDQEALQHEVMHIYQENKARPVRVAYLPVLARVALVSVVDLPLVWSERKQSILDRLAGTMIVLDRPSRRRSR